MFLLQQYVHLWVVVVQRLLELGQIQEQVLERARVRQLVEQVLVQEAQVLVFLEDCNFTITSEVFLNYQYRTFPNPSNY